MLKPNGKLIITYRPKKVMDNIPFVRHGFNVYSDEEAKGLITAGGFEVLEMSEKDEPAQNIHGEIEDVASVILVAKKNNYEV